MAIAAINTCKHGSTGRIMLDIASAARQSGIKYYTFCLRPRKRRDRKQIEGNFYFSNYFEYGIHKIVASLTGLQGCFSHIGTALLIRRFKRLDIDTLHLHNLHNCYINLPMLFSYIKKNNIKVVWTLHDCWAFTGKCPYFDMAGCDRWKTGCGNCPQKYEYPKSYTDKTEKMYGLKVKWFTGIKEMTLVTPSQWLKNLVEQSFLKDYPCIVIRNFVDNTVFKPTFGKFRTQYGIENKKIILGVALGWGRKKGIDIFIKLAGMFDDNYKIVLVGTDKKTDMLLPDNIISIHRTESREQLAEIYTAADVFANPTREEVFGLVNIEALACGTPVVTFESGGSPETVDSTCGIIVERNNIVLLKQKIEAVCSGKTFLPDACITRADYFSPQIILQEYIAVYRQ